MREGTPVYLVCDVDRRGTVSVQCCTVGSWGKQRIQLIDRATGRPVEQRIGTKEVNHYLNPYVLAVSDTPDLHAAAVRIAESFIELHREHIDRLIKSEDFEQQNHHYKQCVRAKLAEFHEPRVIHNGHELKPKHGGER